MNFLDKILSKFGYIKVTNRVNDSIEIVDTEYIFKFKDKSDAIHAMFSSNMYYVLWEIKMNGRKKIEWFIDSKPGISNDDLIEEIFYRFNRELENSALSNIIET